MRRRESQKADCKETEQQLETQRWLLKSKAKRKRRPRNQPRRKKK
jgi:hypothetical protein